jgi:hypothetical protein
VLYVSPETTQYYCVIIHFALGSGGENMFSDTDAACVAIALALYLKKKKNRRWTKERYKQRPHHTHKNLLRDLRMSEPIDYKIICSWIVHPLMGYSRFLPLQSLKQIHARSSHSQSALFGH